MTYLFIDNIEFVFHFISNWTVFCYFYSSEQSSEKMYSFASASECIPWLVVLIIECLAIVILNIITIVVFVKKKRQLQRRSTYLIIHLAIVDLLVGAVSGPLNIEERIAWRSLWAANDWKRCNVVLSAMEVQTNDSLVLLSIYCIYKSIPVNFPCKSYGYFLRTATRNILSIQASLCEEMGL